MSTVFLACTRTAEVAAPEVLAAVLRDAGERVRARLAEVHGDRQRLGLAARAAPGRAGECPRPSQRRIGGRGPWLRARPRCASYHGSSSARVDRRGPAGLEDVRRRGQLHVGVDQRAAADAGRGDHRRRRACSRTSNSPPGLRLLVPQQLRRLVGLVDEVLAPEAPPALEHADPRARPRPAGRRRSRRRSRNRSPRRRSSPPSRASSYDRRGAAHSATPRGRGLGLDYAPVARMRGRTKRMPANSARHAPARISAAGSTGLLPAVVDGGGLGRRDRLRVDRPGGRARERLLRRRGERRPAAVRVRAAVGGLLVRGGDVGATRLDRRLAAVDRVGGTAILRVGAVVDFAGATGGSLIGRASAEGAATAATASEAARRDRGRRDMNCSL